MAKSGKFTQNIWTWDLIIYREIDDKGYSTNYCLFQKWDGLVFLLNGFTI